MNLFKKLKLKRAKKHLMKALKIIDNLSWEELDSILPRSDYKYCFNNNNWKNAEMRYSITGFGERKDA